MSELCPLTPDRVQIVDISVLRFQADIAKLPELVQR
jgi:hypothetical protein